MNAATPAPKQRLASPGCSSAALVKASSASPKRRASIAAVPARASAIGSSAAHASAAPVQAASINAVCAIQSRIAGAPAVMQEEHLRDSSHPTRVPSASWDLSPSAGLQESPIYTSPIPLDKAVRRTQTFRVRRPGAPANHARCIVRAGSRSVFPLSTPELRRCSSATDRHDGSAPVDATGDGRSLLARTAVKGRRPVTKSMNGVRRAPVMLSWLAIGIFMTVYPARPASGQVLYGSMVGTLTDQTGAMVPKATVTVTNTSTGLSRQTTTNEAGYYSVPNLLEGVYDLSVSASGFKPYVQKGISVSINAVTRVDATIQVGAVSEEVRVEATTAVLETTKSDVSVSFDTPAMENLPLSGYRNFQALINLVPGAVPARFQNAVTDTPGRALTTNVNGQERGANNTRVDGSADILVTMPHHTVYVPPVESIQEVNISTNSFDSEQGMTGGAAVTVTTKSGTNEFHGSAFANHDNSALRAFLWDENRAGVKKKPKGIRNIDGGSIGGPIKQGKLFFFSDWEGTFERVNRTVLTSLPTADFRTGDFSRKLGAPVGTIVVPTTEGGTTPLREGMIFDPFTGNVNGTGRSVFSSGGRINVIPAARLNGPMMKLLALVPQPNLPGDLNNFFNSGTQRMNRNNIDAKVNWNRNDRHQLWGKYSVMDALVSGGFSLGAAGGACLCDGGIGQGHTLVQIAGIGSTYTFSPNFLVDGTL